MVQEAVRHRATSASAHNAHLAIYYISGKQPAACPAHSLFLVRISFPIGAASNILVCTTRLDRQLYQDSYVEKARLKAVWFPTMHGPWSNTISFALLLLIVASASMQELRPECIDWQPSERETPETYNQWTIIDPWDHDDDTIKAAVAEVSSTGHAHCERMGKKCQSFIESDLWMYKCMDLDWQPARGTPVVLHDEL
jgi:hypothetical protein